MAKLLSVATNQSLKQVEINVIVTANSRRSADVLG